MSSVQTGTCARALATPGDGAAAADEMLQLGRDGLLQDKCPRPLAGAPPEPPASSSPARTWDMAATRSRGLSLHLPRGLTPLPAPKQRLAELLTSQGYCPLLHTSFTPLSPLAREGGCRARGIGKKPFPLDGSIAPEMANLRFLRLPQGPRPAALC